MAYFSVLLEIKLFSIGKWETVQRAFCETKAVWAVLRWERSLFRETENKPSVSCLPAGRFLSFLGDAKKKKY